ncbi:MAG TPA: 4Fe-4S dicluster domain-containing protein, partial [Vicinamibacteria bacterium]|nr:4Fe-4S dicluster domain-containing protein [Vicinamibacteria bacterium]
MKLARRTFLKAAGVAGVASIVSPATAAVRAAAGRGVLVDTTLCVGCRGCEAACSEANNLPAPAGDSAVLEGRRSTTPTAFTVVNQATAASGAVRYAKSQCLHCLDPACASACPVRALEKTASGPVVYHRDRCMGCRYCMVACPFGVPKYEYDRPVPYVRKCSFCAERQAAGKPPACTEVCPSGALLFGDREQLLETARTRIYQNPDRYLHHVYGEHEAGGTAWLYLSDLPFESLGLPADVGTGPYPELT